MAKTSICDDEAGLRAVIKRYAIFEGHEVMEAGDGMEAVELCRNNNFDLIIMDIMMPELDGFSAVKEIRKTSDTPVIMLSARGEEYDKVLGFEVGVDDYVVKPFLQRNYAQGSGHFRRVRKEGVSQVRCNRISLLKMMIQGLI